MKKKKQKLFTRGDHFRFGFYKKNNQTDFFKKIKTDSNRSVSV